jgi:type VI secretion system protein VasD
MRRRLLVRAAASLLLGVSLVGCTEVPPPAEPDPCNIQMVTLRIYADDVINPNENDRPRPVQVRLYQLANDLKMANAKYDDILLRDAKTLGDDMMSVNEVTVFPNDLVEVKFERIPEAFYLAGAAMFHDPQGQSWKTFYEFPPMPNTPEACQSGQEEGEPQAFPETAFFVVERKIDNGSQYDESMFPQATPIRSLNLPKRSAGSDGAAVAPAK